MMREAMERMANNYKLRYGRKPLGFCLGPAEAVCLATELHVPGDTLRVAEFMGLPIRLTSSPGLEVEIDHDAMMQEYVEIVNRTYDKALQRA